MSALFWVARARATTRDKVEFLARSRDPRASRSDRVADEAHEFTRRVRVSGGYRLHKILLNPQGRLEGVFTTLHKHHYMCTYTLDVLSATHNIYKESGGHAYKFLRRLLN